MHFTIVEVRGGVGEGLEGRWGGGGVHDTGGWGQAGRRVLLVCSGGVVDLAVWGHVVSNHVLLSRDEVTSNHVYEPCCYHQVTR